MDDSAFSRNKSKTPDRALACRLCTEVGLNPAQIRVTIELLGDHLQDYFSDVRLPGTIIHTAVSDKEPAGKPIKHCKIVPVRLTQMHDADLDVLHRYGPVELRAIRLYRFACEAQEQGALLSQQDLSFLLCVDPSTVKDLVRKLRLRGLEVPTRGAIKDIGPEPSHKRVIAELLGRGFSTSQIRAATRHSELSIGRYQRQFGLVLYLIHTYPEANDEELRRLADLSAKAFHIYREVLVELAECEDCQPHLERLRRFYQLDPDGSSRQIPAGKTPYDDSTRRLNERTLSTALRQTIQEDLGTTKRIAQVVSGDIAALIDDSFQITERLRPGQAVIFVDAHDPSFISGERVADRPVLPVTVPVYTDEAKAIWRSDEPATRRRARIAALIATSAQEQGGVMTIAGLAELLHVAPTTMSADLRKLAIEVHVQAPIKGILEDAGQTLTHKDWIVALDHHGLTGQEISWLTRHAPHSRDRYIETYRRAETLMRLEGQIPEPEHLARVLRLRCHVAEQYVNLLQRYSGAGIHTKANDSTVDLQSTG